MTLQVKIFKILGPKGVSGLKKMISIAFGPKNQLECEKIDVYNKISNFSFEKNTRYVEK